MCAGNTCANVLYKNYLYVLTNLLLTLEAFLGRVARYECGGAVLLEFVTAIYRVVGTKQYISIIV